MLLPRWMRLPLVKLAPLAVWAFMMTVRFFQERRNKAQCNGHHHGQFMSRHADPLKGIQEVFDAVRSRRWATSYTSTGTKKR